MSSWRQWRALAPDERRKLVQAAALLVYARLRLPFIGFRADLDAVQRAGSTELPAIALQRAQLVSRLVAIAAGHSPVRVSCLHRSLVLWWLLRREGIPCELRLGARTDTGEFEAHAWVRCAGVALDQQPAELARYRPFGEAVLPVGRAGRWRFALRRAG